MDGNHPATHSILPSEAEPDLGPDLGAVERRARHLRILAELADIGMELAKHVRRQALEEVVPPAPDLASEGRDEIHTARDPPRQHPH